MTGVDVARRQWLRGSPTTSALVRRTVGVRHMQYRRHASRPAASQNASEMAALGSPFEQRSRPGVLRPRSASFGVVLEICPTSNLLTGALADEDDVRFVFRTFSEHGVPFAVATDGPEMMRTRCATSSSCCCGSAPPMRTSCAPPTSGSGGELRGRGATRPELARHRSLPAKGADAGQARPPGQSRAFAVRLRTWR